MVVERDMQYLTAKLRWILGWLLGRLWVGLFAVCSASAHAQLQFEWRDRFSEHEETMLTDWLQQTYAALQEAVGPLPFDVLIYFHRADRGSGPVPWAHTQRGSRQGVHFYVNTRQSARSFLSDWTASHELSHLVIPYLGERHAWFAEGFASFMQFQVMRQLGVIDQGEMMKRYLVRFEKARSRYTYDDVPFAEAAPQLRSQGQYPTMYWGGALYFWQVNQALQQQGEGDLIAVLREYLACCRMRRQGLQGLTKQLDQLSDTVLFTSTLTEFRSRAGFPRYEEAADKND